MVFLSYLLYTIHFLIKEHIRSLVFSFLIYYVQYTLSNIGKSNPFSLFTANYTTTAGDKRKGRPAQTLHGVFTGILPVCPETFFSFKLHFCRSLLFLQINHRYRTGISCLYCRTLIFRRHLRICLCHTVVIKPEYFRTCRHTGAARNTSIIHYCFHGSFLLVFSGYPRQTVCLF